MNKEVKGGIAADYGDMILWIENPELGANAAKIEDESEYTPCKITKIIARSEFADDDEYSAACDDICNESVATCTGEVFTFDETYYVEIDAVGDPETYDGIDFDDTDFC